MPYWKSSREQAKARLLRIEAEISEILRTFPELAQLTHRRRRARASGPDQQASNGHHRPHGARPRGLRTLH